MTMKKMVSTEDPILSTNLEPFDFSNPPIDPQELADTMIEHLVHYKGLGLSANQIGLPYRVFAVNTEPEKLVCFNPSISWFSDEMSVISEGCLTYPGLYVKIRRPTNIRAKFFTVTGQISTQKLGGLVSRCFQHELDHLDGINYLDRASKYHLDQAKRKMKHVNRKIRKLQLGEYYGNQNAS